MSHGGGARKGDDKYGLLDLSPGQMKFYPIPREEINLGVHRVQNSALHFRTAGKMNAPLFTSTVINKDECGVLYGLKKGF